MRRTVRQRTPIRAGKIIVAAAILSQATQIAAFSPASSPPNGLVHAITKSWRGCGNGNKTNKHELDLRTARVSNLVLSASAASVASTAASSTASTTATASVTNTVIKPISQSNLAVSLDRPLLSPVEYSYRAPSSSTRGVWSSFLTVLLSDVFKTALVAFLLALGVSFLPKLVATLRNENRGSGNSNNGNGNGAMDKLSSLASRIVAPLQTILPSTLKKSSSKQRSKKETYTQPMPFEGDGGWGKCTLRSKRSIGSFTIYEFALPESYYTVPLALGQQLEFCCLSAGDDICTGSFYPYADGGSGAGAGAGAGMVRVVLPNGKEGDEGSSKFNEVLRNELRPGDEVAIKPGKSHLTYHGTHVPVTDMVYLASGLGIVPVLDQIKAITPRGSSSVKVSSVTWFNDKRDDFDLAMDDLEAEYLKYPSKLAVSCIMDDVMKNPLEGNKEVEEAVPYFDKGTMAVVAGPKRFAEKARGYLMRRGYPENCICVLP